MGMHRLFIIGAIAAALMIPLPAAPAAGKSVTLRLDQPTKTDRGGLPVSNGLPLAKGVLASPENLRVLDAAGTEVPSQVRALSLWPDGSVKAALLDFQADIPADRDGSVTVEYGPGVKPMARAKGIQVRKDGEKVTVDTGAIKFTISKGGCGWMDEVQAGGKVVGKGINFARFKGDAAPNKAVVTKITVEEGGDIPNPLRVAIKVEGFYAGRLRTPFLLRIHAYAGKPFVKAVHTFVYAGDRFKPEDHLAELEIGIELAGGAKRILYGIEGSAPVEPGPADGAAVLYSRDDLNYTITGAAAPALPADRPAGWWMDPGGKPAGWMRVAGDASAVQMGVRDLWQNYPKALRVEGNRATLSLWPKEHAPFDLKTNHRFFLYDVRTKKLGPWNDSDPALDRQAISGMHEGKGTGAAKAHELYFNFQAAPEPAGLSAAFAAFQEPTYLIAEPRWYADTRIFGVFNPAGMDYKDPNLRKWDQALELKARWLLLAPRYWRWYGMWDYGDLIMAGPHPEVAGLPAVRFPPGPRPPAEHGRWDYDNQWKSQIMSNCHYDLIEALLLHHMRTGKREYRRFAEVLAAHTNEVDGKYPTGGKADAAAEGPAAPLPRDDEAGEDAGSESKFGLTSRHGCGHGQISASHSFVRHRRPLYFLTGNERIREAMRLAYDSISADSPRIFGNGVTIRNPSCATGILETWWSMSGDKESSEKVRFILYYWLSRQQTRDDLGNYVGINKTWGRTKGGANEAFDPFNIMPKARHEVTDPNAWDHPQHKQTVGWRFMNFGASEAMMDWYFLTGDEKVGASVVRFIRATKIHGSQYNWYRGQQLLSFAFRLTREEVFREWLRSDMAFSRWGPLSRPETTIDLKDNMTWEDFHREFSKFHSKERSLGYMGLEGSDLLMQPSAMYAFEPYDQFAPPALSTGARPEIRRPAGSNPPPQAGGPGGQPAGGREN